MSNLNKKRFLGFCLVLVIVSSFLFVALSNKVESEESSGDVISENKSEKKENPRVQKILDGEKVKLSKNELKDLTSEDKEYYEDFVSVVFKDIDNQNLRSVASDMRSQVPEHSLNKRIKVGESRYSSMRVPDGMDVEEFLSELNEMDEVVLAEPLYVRELTWEPEDPEFGASNSQWQLDDLSTSGSVNYGIDMPKAWDYMNTQLGLGGCSADNNCGGSPSVVVAVLDTGLAYESSQREVTKPGSYEDAWLYEATSEVPGNIWVNTDETLDGGASADDDDGNGYNDDRNGVNIIDYYYYRSDRDTPYTEEAYPDDDHGHGTHVSHIIAGATDNASGGSGIAYNTTIMPVKVAGWDGGVYAYNEGVVYAADNGADIINMSYGGANPSSVEEANIEDAVSKGVIPVAASGNYGVEGVQYPAAYDDVIAVGASNQNGSRSSYSNYGSDLDVVAPVGESGFSQTNYGCYFDRHSYDPPEEDWVEDYPEVGLTVGDEDREKFPSCVSCNFGDDSNCANWDPVTNSFISGSESFESSSGTSFASPQVAAVSALIKTLHPTWNLDKVRYAIRHGAVGVTSYSNTRGFGVLNANNSLRVSEPTDEYRPVYRFWSDRNRGHFYTISEYEKNYVIDNYSDYEWKYERVAFYASPYDGSCPEGMSEVYRFWSDQNDMHFYTISNYEKNYVIDNYTDYQWRYERVAYCGYQSERPDATALYRFWSDQNRGHFYTASEYEKDYVIENYTDYQWKYERVGYYIYDNSKGL